MIGNFTYLPGERMYIVVLILKMRYCTFVYMKDFFFSTYFFLLKILIKKNKPQIATLKDIEIKNTDHLQFSYPYVQNIWGGGGALC